MVDILLTGRIPVRRNVPQTSDRRRIAALRVHVDRGRLPTPSYVQGGAGSKANEGAITTHFPGIHETIRSIPSIQDQSIPSPPG
jgi:hypothetical protein